MDGPEVEIITNLELRITNFGRGEERRVMSEERGEKIKEITWGFY